MLDYDVNGNLLEDGSRALTWDYQNRLTSAYTNGATTTYAYSHTGSRVSKTAGNTTTHYAGKYFDRAVSPSGTTTQKHIFLPASVGGTLIATVEGSGTEATVLYKHLDHLGSTRVITNTDGMMEQVLDHHPFGTQRINANYTGLTTRQTYTGHELDGETELVYMQARYQEPEWGRFVSQDPAARRSPEQFLTDPQQLNYYSYVANSPIMYIDPTGETLQDIVAGAINSFLSNQVMGAGRVDSQYYTGNQTHYDYGQIAGDLAALIVGSTQIAAGTTIGTAGTLATVGTGGAAAVISVPAAVGGAALTTHGITSAGTAAYNLSQAPKPGSAGGIGAGKNFPKSVKDRARTESENRCVFCGESTTRVFGPTQSNIDHAIPKSRGGNNSITNAQNTCRTCNLVKGVKTTVEYVWEIFRR